jgi:hypothetical protein
MKNPQQITIVLQPAPPPPKRDRDLLVALIGGAALVVAALLAGIFGLAGTLAPIIGQHWKP